MFKKIALAAVIGLFAMSVQAADNPKPEKSIALKDGSTVHIYKDGKMAMESKHGRPQHMKDGQVMETKDGQKIMMKGNEIWRLETHD